MGRKGRIKGLAILGSTGSIGRNTLDIVRRHPERFRVVSLSAGNNIRLLRRQVEEFGPRFVSLIGEGAAGSLRSHFPRSLRTGFGEEGACRAASFEGVDAVVSAISGAAGLMPTLSAIRAGKDIALANKETLVMAGPIVMEEARLGGVSIMPVDSEHSAIFQALSGQRLEDVRRIILTASGGPFLKLPLKRLTQVSPAEALRHPKWKMGRKITVDSATLVNKGLEVIEARWLFGVPPERISVLIHPQSVVHSMVEFSDGSVIAQMSSPDMKGAIAYALACPERIDSGMPPLKMRDLRLEFMEPDGRRFPCLSLCYRALQSGGAAPAVLNAADEVAVGEFLKGSIRFTDIYRVISHVLEMHRPAGGAGASTVEEILSADRWAREEAGGYIREFSR